MTPNNEVPYPKLIRIGACHSPFLLAPPSTNDQHFGAATPFEKAASRSTVGRIKERKKELANPGKIGGTIPISKLEDKSKPEQLATGVT